MINCTVYKVYLNKAVSKKNPISHAIPSRTGEDSSLLENFPTTVGGVREETKQIRKYTEGNRSQVSYYLRKGL